MLSKHKYYDTSKIVLVCDKHKRARLTFQNESRQMQCRKADTQYLLLRK